MSRAAEPSSGLTPHQVSAGASAAESGDFSAVDAAGESGALLAGTDALSRIVVVLSHTSHPGNIGAAARAMKTMGLTDLRLSQVFPNEIVTARSGATDLPDARVFTNLKTHCRDCVRRRQLSARARFRR
ncbi:TrmH family RNA methyltransferase [Casimicrobium huifangae]|uniref:TrmH family RNA methyltransferase n=1 Tax=Casimicrobium huifangae TaxID=2591109 RepID=UPI003784EDF1